MTFKALLVSKDDEAAAVLTRVLSGLGIGVQGCGYTDAIRELTEQKFDAVLVDFDDHEKSTQVLQNSYLASPHNSAVTFALLRDKSEVRGAFGAGANFVLYKPISAEQAQASLRAATALIKRERRRSMRVPVQLPVELIVENGLDVEGILLDLSEDGMEVLSSQPLCPSSSLRVQFALPDGSAQITSQAEIAWASPNGQTGVRFAALGENQAAGLRAWLAANAKRLPPDEPDSLPRCQLTDLSLGGCYVETESPFPERSGVILLLSASGMEAQALGMVRVMHPGLGMGIEFASRTAKERDQVADFIHFLRSQSGVAPELSVIPRSLVSGNDPGDGESHGAEEYDDPLLDLLRGHESLSEDEFLRELRKQRGAVAAAFS